MTKALDYHTPIYLLKYNDGRNTFYIKRDDLLPFSFGGNKVRIAECYFRDMVKTGCDCMIAYGDSRSNLCRVVANMSKSKNIPCFVITPDGRSDGRVNTYNSAFVRAMDAYIIPCRKSNVAKTIARTMDQCEVHGLKPYYIYGDIYGRGTEAVAVQAYVDVYNEIIQYEKGNGISFDYIFLATGTGNTQAGLICGSLLHGDDRRIIGISVARNKERGYQAIANNIGAYRGQQEEFSRYIHFEDKYVLGGYGEYNDQIIGAIKNILGCDGIPLDPVYTGKAFWGMTEYLKNKSIIGMNILFVHTGGLPLFYDNLVNILP